MNLHEYQSKRCLPNLALTFPKASRRVRRTKPWRPPNRWVAISGVVKAQVHAGGRGKAGGVKLSRSLEEVRAAAEAMLGTTLVTHQSGPEGLPVNVVYVEAGSAIERELYLSMLVDREVSKVAFIASAAGGMDIEAVAEDTPEKIFTVAVSPSAGLMDYQARQLAFGLGLNKTQSRQFADLIRRLYRLYIDCDASLVEVNPLIVTKAGDVLALDAKVQY